MFNKLSRPNYMRFKHSQKRAGTDFQISSRNPPTLTEVSLNRDSLVLQAQSKRESLHRQIVTEAPSDDDLPSLVSKVKDTSTACPIERSGACSAANNNDDAARFQ